MKIVWLTKSSAKYKMKLLDEIGKKVNLTVLFIEHKNKNRASDFYSDLDGHYNLVLLNNLSQAETYIKDADIFVNSYYASFWGYYCVFVAKKYGVKTFLQADGGIPKKRPLVNKMISHFMERHDYCLSSSKVTDEYFNFYLKNKKKIYHYHISSLLDEDVQKNHDYSNKKELYKKELNLNNFTFISVGQMIPRKGFDVLLKSYKESGLNDCTNLLMIGGKPYDQLIKIKKDLNLTNAKFIDAIPKEELNKYYAASDAFVFATREDIWGLVINEALSFGLPLISSDNCVAAKHFYEENDIGILVENENIEGFANAMKNIYDNQELRETMRKKELDTAPQYTIEKSAIDIVDAFKKLSMDISK